LTSRIHAPAVPLLLILLSILLGQACRSAGSQAAPSLVQPGAPGGPTRDITAAEAADLSHVRHTPADVRFMQGMISHHAQALVMAALVPSRTGRDDMRALALRIEISQGDEIEMMREWLEARAAQVPGEHDHHAHGDSAMPGMLTAGEMRGLTAAKGDAFDRLFLQLMIKHHEGALVMVRELFSSPRGGQEGSIFAFASDVEADQQMEIARMRALLASTGKEPRP
jgi:uncharacterized protein (DUF305 family)